jgi:hypothetical protein
VLAFLFLVVWVRRCLIVGYFVACVLLLFLRSEIVAPFNYSIIFNIVKLIRAEPQRTDVVLLKKMKTWRSSNKQRTQLKHNRMDA